MKLKLHPAEVDDVEELVELRNDVANDLTERYGKGPWSGQCTERGILFDMRNARVYVARRGGAVIGSLLLATKKPWAIDRSYFTPCERPLYLTSMVVAPELQREGVGRACLDEAVRLSREWPAQAIYLDAYDAEAGAGEFYRKCGFRETGRVVYREVPLIYFEKLV